MTELSPQALKDTIDHLGLTYKVSARSYIFNCPICSKNKLYISKSGYYTCFACALTHGTHGKNPAYILSQLGGCSILEVRSKLYGEIRLTHLAEDFDFPIPDFNPICYEEPQEEPCYETKVYPYSVLRLDDRRAKKGLDYAISRGISLELAQKYELRYNSYTQRLVFPVKMGGSLVGWQERLCGPDKVLVDNQLVKYPKILTESGTPRDKVVMFWDQVVGDEHVILTEGPIDALKAHLCGNAVASMGKCVSKAQLDLLLDLAPRKVYLGLDPDAMEESLELMWQIPASTELYLLEPARGYKDLGEMTPEAVLEEFKAAKPISRGKLYYANSFNFPAVKPKP